MVHVTSRDRSERITTLITGAQGFLGRYLADALLGEPRARVVGVGRSPHSDTHFTHSMTWRGEEIPAPLPQDLLVSAADPRLEYCQADLTEAGQLEEVLTHATPDMIVHSAAALRDTRPEQLFEANLTSTLRLFEAVAQLPGPAPLVVVVSSGSVYGVAAEGGERPRAEDDPCDPADMYAATKRASEDVARVLARRYEIPTIIARAFNLVGPGLQDRHFPARIAHLLVAYEQDPRSPPDLPVGRLDTVRDLIDIRDTARAILALIRHGVPGCCYNVGSGVPTRMNEVLETLLHLAAKPPRVVEGPTRPVDIEHLVADTAALRALGFRCRYDLATSLADMVEYARSLSH